jgi:hypothetical protein
MSSVLRTRAKSFVAASSVVLALFLALCALPGVLAFFETRWSWVGTGFAVVELTVLVGTMIFHPDDVSPRGQSDPFPSEVIERINYRFASARDFEATEAIYREWFPRSLSIPDAEYCVLMDRGCYERVQEVVFSDGSRRITGYYAVWPISDQTFASLLSGALKEKDISSTHVLKFDDPNATVLYCPEIGASRDAGLGGQLLSDARSYGLHLLKQHPNLQKAAAWAYTKYGERIVKNQLRMPAPKRLFSRFHVMSRDQALAVLARAKPFEPDRTVSL